MALDDTRVTPAHRKFDGHNYYPTRRWVLFGHHFAAITGAGPLIGPVLAAQFGYAPGFIWIVSGLLPGGRGARFRLALGVDPPRRPLAVGHRADRDWPGRRNHRRGRRPLHRRHRAGGTGAGGRQRARGERVGHVHHRRQHSAGDADGLSHVRVAEGAHQGGHHRRRHADDPGGDPRPAGREFGDRILVPALPPPDHDRARASTDSPPRCCRCGCC